MSAEFVEEIAKPFQDKKLKKFTPFIIGGVVLLGIFSFMKKPKVAESSFVGESSGVGGNLGGVYNDMVGQVNEQLKGNDKMISDYMKSQEDKISLMENNVLNILTSTKAEYDKKLSDSISKISSPVYSPVYTNAVPESKPSIMESLSNTISNVITAINGGDNSIYYDNVADDVQYKQVQNYVGGLSVSDKEKQTIKSSVAGLGNNGENFNANHWSETEQRLKTDTSFVQSEIERAKLVIENRKSSGLDISKQEKYLNQLMTTYGG